MKHLDRAVFLDLLPPFLLGTSLFTAILSFGYFFVSSQWLVGVPIVLILQWIGASIPDTLVKVMPMATVLMVVVVFGRMATERELIAAQAGGIHLGRLALPALFLAALVSGLAFWLSLWVAPQSNVQQRSLYWDTLVGGGLSPLRNKTLDLGGQQTLYFSGYDHGTRQMQNVRIEQWPDTTPQQGTIIFAKTGRFEDQTLSLKDYQLYTVNYAQINKLKQTHLINPFGLKALGKKVFPRAYRSKTGEVLKINTGTSRKRSIADYADAIGADAAGWSELQAKLNDPKLSPDEQQNTRVTLQRKMALPFANMVLALCALPFALRFGRSLGISLGLALLISVAYYVVFSVGLTLIPALHSLMAQFAQIAQTPFAHMSAALGAWFANGLFLLLGLVWLRRGT